MKGRADNEKIKSVLADCIYYGAAFYRCACVGGCAGTSCQRGQAARV